MGVTIASTQTQKLDNTIRLVASTAEGGDVPNYVADNSQVRAEFYQAGNRVVFISRGRSVTWEPSMIKYVDDWGMEDVIYSVQDAPLEVNGHHARVNRAYPDVDDRFTVENDRLKHSIIVQGYQRGPVDFLDPDSTKFVVGGVLSYDTDLTVRYNGLTLVGEFDASGAIEICDGENVVFTLPPIVAFDSKYPERSETDGFYRVTANDGGVLAFDIVVDNAWISDTAREYPIVIDPTVVATNGVQDYIALGTEIVRRVHGTNTIFSLALDRVQGSVYGYNLYRSTDNGSTWSLAAAVTDPDAGASSMSKGCLMVTSTGEVYIFAVSSSNNQTVYYYPGSGSTVTYKRFTTGQPTGVGSCTDPNGNVWFVCGTGASIVAYFIPKGNISGSVQLTVATSNSVVYATRNAFFDSVSNAIYCSFNVASSSVGVMKITPNSIVSPTAITYTNMVTIGATSSASSTITRLQNGNVLLAYTNGTVTSITAAEYTLAGVLVSSKTVTALPSAILTGTGVSADAYLGATSDGSNWYLFAICGSATPYSLVFSKNGGAWTTLQSPAQYASVSQLSEYSVTAKTNLDYVFLANATTPRTLSFDSVTLNTPPLAPTPTQHANFDATVAQSLAWTFNDTVGDTQSAYQLEIYDTANTSTPVVTVAKTGSTTSAYNLAANTLVNGKTYQWRVLTYDAAGAASPWSAYSTFKCSASPTVSVTAPGTVVSDNFTATGSYVQAAGAPQKSFQFRLWNAAGTTILQDSGEIIGTTNAKTFAGLANNTSYMIEMIGTSQDGVSSSSGLVAFSVAYTPPATPVVTALNDAITSRIIVSWTNPTPSGGQPVAASNNVYRRKVGTTTWTLVAPAVTSPYSDYLCPAGNYEYGVTALSAAGSVSAYGTKQVLSLFTGQWIIDESNPSAPTVFMYNEQGADITIEEDRAEVRTFAAYPFERKGVTRNHSGTVSALWLKGDGDVMDRIDALDAMSRADKTYILKLASGRNYRVTVAAPKYQVSNAGAVADVQVTWKERGAV